MNIQIKDYVGLTEQDILVLADSLFKNRKSEIDNFNYGLETHGVFEKSKLPVPVLIRQSNKRKTNKSPIILEIKTHISIL